MDNSLTGIGNDNYGQIDALSGRPAGANSMKMWFNTAAFTTNAIGTFGDSSGALASRKSCRPNSATEAFNVLNRANFRLFYSPGAYQSTLTLTSPTFGQITYADDPRLMQVALKLRF